MMSDESCLLCARQVKRKRKALGSDSEEEGDDQDEKDFDPHDKQMAAIAAGSFYGSGMRGIKY